MNLDKATLWRSKVSEFTQAAIQEHLKDVKIICKDGVMMWNSFLICQWSSLIEAFVLKNPGLATSPLVVLIPDLEVATLGKLLAWSTKGHVILSQWELQEVSSTLRLFKVNVELSHVAIKAEPLGSQEQGQRQDQCARQGLAADLESSSANPVRGKSCNEKRQEKPSRGRVDQDPLDLHEKQGNFCKDEPIEKGHQYCSSIEHPDHSHLSSDRDEGRKAQECDEPFPKRRRTSRSRRGLHSERIMDSAIENPEEEPVDANGWSFDRQSECRESSDEYNPDEESDVDYSSEESQDYESLEESNNDEVGQENIQEESEEDYMLGNAEFMWQCIVCKYGCKLFRDLKIHVAKIHSRRHLIKLWGNEIDGPCPLCKSLLFAGKTGGKEMMSPREKWTQIAIHLGYHHGKVFEVKPEKIRDWLKQLRQHHFAPKRGQRSHLLGKNGLNFSKLFFKWCARCQASFSNRTALLCHLALSHYTAELDAACLASVDCQRCVSLSSGETDPLLMSSHVMNVHPENFIALLPDECRKFLTGASQDRTEDDFQVEEAGKRDDVIMPTPLCFFSMAATDSRNKDDAEDNPDVVCLNGPGIQLSSSKDAVGLKDLVVKLRRIDVEEECRLIKIKSEFANK